MSITPAILSQLPLPEITSVVFYKRDQITFDLVCCDVEVGGQVWTFHEEAEGWDALLRHIEKLPGFRSDWQAAVVLPPFRRRARRWRSNAENKVRYPPSGDRPLPTHSGPRLPGVVLASC